MLRPSRIGLACALLLLASTLIQCTSPADTAKVDPAETAAEQALLRRIAEDVVQPSVATFATEATALNTAVKAWCPTLSGDATKAQTAQKSAQDAWLRTAKAWQRLLPMSIGPHADADVAEAIDSWPLVNPCAVDQGVSALLKAGTVDIAGSLPNQKGLDALETLLFRASLETLCPPQAAPEGWSTLSDAAKSAARCAYAEQVAGALDAQATKLQGAWKSGPTSYVEVLAHAGDAATSGKAWASSHAALNALSDAVLKLETDVKGRRLGAPIGIAANPCGTVAVACSKAIESPWAHQGTALLQANLAGARAVLLGGSTAGTENDAEGFDDWLVRKGAGPAATAMKTHLDQTRDAFAALPSSLQDGLAKDPKPMKAAYDALGALTHHLETQLLVALSLQVPAAVAGDAD